MILPLWNSYYLNVSHVHDALVFEEFVVVVVVDDVKIFVDDVFCNNSIYLILDTNQCYNYMRSMNNCDDLCNGFNKYLKLFGIKIIINKNLKLMKFKLKIIFTLHSRLDCNNISFHTIQNQSYIHYNWNNLMKSDFEDLKKVEISRFNISIYYINGKSMRAVNQIKNK